MVGSPGSTEEKARLDILRSEILAWVLKKAYPSELLEEHVGRKRARVGPE